MQNFEPMSARKQDKKGPMGKKPDVRSSMIDSPSKPLQHKGSMINQYRKQMKNSQDFKLPLNKNKSMD